MNSQPDSVSLTVLPPKHLGQKLQVLLCGMDTEELGSLALRVGALIEERDLPLSLGAWVFSGLGGAQSKEERHGIEFHKTLTGASSPGRFSAKNLSKYSEFISSKEFETFRTVAIKLMNRLDFSGTFRMLEREVVLQRAVLDAIRLLERRKPILLVFPVSPHLFLPYVAANVANFLKIPVLHFQPCPIAPVVFPHLVADGHSRLLEPDVQSKLSVNLVEKARQKLKALGLAQDPTYMQLQKSNDESASLLGRRVISIFRTVEMIFSRGSGASDDFFSHRFSSPLLRRVLRLFLIRVLKKELRQASRVLPGTNPTSSNYSIFALHYEPERTSLPEGLPIVFQADAIAIARSMVPPEQTLIVKEHYSQTSSSLRGFQGRSPMMYSLLQSYEGLDFVSSKERLSDLLDKANCVFTLTGTIAIESVLRGVPVAYFGSPWWSGMPGSVRVSSESDFREVISTPVPNSNLVEEFFINLIQRHSIPGLGGESVDTIEKKLGSLGSDFASEESAAILDLIVLTLQNKGS